MNPELTIIYEWDEGGRWIATIPEVPGAFSQGRTPQDHNRSDQELLRASLATDNRDTDREL